MSMRNSLAAITFVLFCVQATIAAVPEGITQITSVEGITEYQLENGLQVLLFPDNSKSTITVNITYRVGSRHEGRGRSRYGASAGTHGLQGHADF